MRILVISDLHLTNRFKWRKFKFLSSLILNYDQVIICGDFWSAYTCTFDKFLKSKWNALFPLLKSRNAIYLYGNHDRERWCDDRVEQFCVKAKHSHSLTQGKVTYHFTHGVEYLADSINNEIFMFCHRIFKWDLISSFLDKMALFILGYKKYTKVASKMNDIQKFAVSSDSRVSVMGHTHSPEIDLKSKYVNCGFINLGHASYFEIEGRECKLVVTTY